MEWLKELEAETQLCPLLLALQLPAAPPSAALPPMVAAEPLLPPMVAAVPSLPLMVAAVPSLPWFSMDPPAPFTVPGPAAVRAAVKEDKE